jgi:hypothetical protein
MLTVANRAGSYHDFKFGMVPSTLTADTALSAEDQKNIQAFCLIVFFLLGDSPASEFYMLTFRNTLPVPSL